jgi:hypothetical protein
VSGTLERGYAPDGKDVTIIRGYSEKFWKTEGPSVSDAAEGPFLFFIAYGEKRLYFPPGMYIMIV